MAQRFLFNGAVRGIEYSTSPNGLVIHTQRHTVLSPTPILPKPSSLALFVSFFMKILTFSEHKSLTSPRGAVNSWFVIVSDYHLIYHIICLPLWNVTHSGNRSSKTFKPKKNIPEGSHQYELLKHAEATLGSGNLRMAVMLPEGEDLNEWVAVNSKHQFYLLFTHSLIYPCSSDSWTLFYQSLSSQSLYLHASQ